MLRELRITLQRLRFHGSAAYWQERYTSGGTSGPGSYGEIARHKAEYLNSFIERRAIRSVIEFGCGDGNQLSLARYPRYLGLDVSPAAVALCLERFSGDPNKSFAVYTPALFSDPARFVQAELSMSLDVIFHLIEDGVFYTYMEQLFAAATRYVVIYSRDDERPRQAGHVRYRRFSDWIASNAAQWHLVESLQAPSEGHEDFWVYAPSSTDGADESTRP